MDSKTSKKYSQALIDEFKFYKNKSKLLPYKNILINEYEFDIDNNYNYNNEIINIECPSECLSQSPLNIESNYYQNIRFSQSVATVTTNDSLCDESDISINSDNNNNNNNNNDIISENLCGICEKVCLLYYQNIYLYLCLFIIGIFKSSYKKRFMDNV